MRVIIYVPESRGSARTRRALEREVTARGHEIVGATSIAVEAKAAHQAGVADVIAGRPEHLIDLAEWALPIAHRSSYRALDAVTAFYRPRRVPTQAPERDRRVPPA